MHPTKTFKTLLLTVAVACGAVASMASVAHAQDTTTREQRMEEALQSHRSAASKNPQPGPVARAEEATKRGVSRAGTAVKNGAERTGEAIKHGAQRTGSAIKHGAQKAGNAVGTGMEKTGDAVRRGGEKLKDGSAG